MKFLTLIVVLLCAVTARAAENLNIIVIYADDMGYGDCTINNPDSKILTPNIDRLTKEYVSNITELQQKLDDVLTDEQKEARKAEQKQALAEGLKGVKLRAAADAAARMTDEQKKLVDELRQVISKLSRERRSKLHAIVTEKKQACQSRQAAYDRLRPRNNELNI